MGKYLIQDIIPPERRHNPSGGKHAGESTPSEHHARTVHVRTRQTARPERRSAASQVTHHADNAVIVQERNPRGMILEQMTDDAPAAAVEINASEPQETSRVPYSGASTVEYNQSPVHQSNPVLHFEQDEKSAGGTWKSWTPWVFGPIFVGVVVIVFMTMNAGATITLLPKHEAIPIDKTLLALKNPTGDELAFWVMKVDLEETREVPATGEKTVTAKASGKLIVYNKQTVAQRLIKNTRFQSTAGKVYRINESINVPKATVKSGITTPGSLEVTVYADEAGPDYNSVPTDFTLPGLKGSPTFEKVYARSKGSLAGGASGTLKTVSDQDMKQAGDDLRIQLETKLRAKARSGLTPSQIGYDQGIIVELGEAQLSKTLPTSADKAVVTQSGTLYMVTFDKEVLVSSIAKELIKTYAGEKLTIKNLETLEISLPAQKGEELWSAEKLEFTIKGTPDMTWAVDETKIKEALVGIPKANFDPMLRKFLNVERANAVVEPRWKRSFPIDPKDIEIKIVESMPAK